MPLFAFTAYGNTTIYDIKVIELSQSTRTVCLKIQKIKGDLTIC